MSNGIVTIDNTRVMALLDGLSLTNKETRTAFRRGISKAASVIQKQARHNLDSIVNRASGTKLQSQNLKRWVRLTVYKNAKGARVDVMGKAKKGVSEGDRDYKQFIIRFFATGTDARYTKSHTRTGQGRRGVRRTGRGGYRGRIAEYQFFRKAVEAKQKEAEKILGQCIVDQINKVVKRRKK